MRRFVKALNRERGVTVTEFAILAPLFFLLIMTIIEGGRIFSIWLIITNEAREGARYAAVKYGYDDLVRQSDIIHTVRDRVESRVGSVISADPGHLQVVVQTSKSQSQIWSVYVTVYYKVDIVTPLIQNLLPNPFSLQAASVMRVE